MKPLTLRAHIRPLPEYLPRTKALEQTIMVGVGYDGAWYRSQKEHWLGWLNEYDGPGAYDRSDRVKRNAETIYNRIQCAPMLFWLAEALAMDNAKLEAAFATVTRIDFKGARQCAGLREHITWLDIEAGLDGFNYNLFQKLRIKAAKHSIRTGGQNGGR